MRVSKRKMRRKGERKKREPDRKDSRKKKKKKKRKRNWHRRKKILSSFFFLIDSGEVYCWGENFDGQLGNGTIVSSEVVLLNEWLKKKVVPVIDIQCGEAHVWVLSVSGNVYSWGSNRFGQLGHGDNKTRTRPELVKTLRRKEIAQIACGANHSAALTRKVYDPPLLLSPFCLLTYLYQKGVLWTCGAGGYGQLGQGGTSNESDIRAVPDLDGVVMVSCGRAHTVAVVDNMERRRISL
jgi:E3 ubiquitin-protein ligase HERC4